MSRSVRLGMGWYRRDAGTRSRRASRRIPRTPTCSRSGPTRSSARSCTMVCCRRSRREWKSGPGGELHVRGVVQRIRGPGPGDRHRVRRRRGDPVARRRHGAPGQGRAGEAGLEGRAGQGDDHAQPGGHRPSAGQSQGDQGLVRPGQAGRRRALSRSQDLRRSAVEHQRDLRVGLSGVARGQAGPARPERGPRLPGKGPGQRRQHGPVGPAEHGQFRRTRDRRRGRHLRERALAAQQGERPDSVRDPAGDALDREPGGGRRDRGRVARQPGGGRGIPGVPLVGPGAADRRGVRVPAGQARGAAAGPGAQPLPPKLFTMADLGGWAKIEQELYGPKGLWTSIFTANTGAQASGR